MQVECGEDLMSDLFTARTSSLTRWRHNFRRGRTIPIGSDENAVGPVDHAGALGAEAVLLQVAVEGWAKKVEVDKNNLLLKNWRFDLLDKNVIKHVQDKKIEEH